MKAKLYWIILASTLITCTALAFGVYEITVQGIQVSADQAWMRRNWTGLAAITILSRIGVQLSKHQWRRLIAGLDAKNLPNQDQLDRLKKDSTQTQAIWIADMTSNFLHSGFCHNVIGKSVNTIGLCSGVASVGLLGAAFLDPISGTLAIAGIATGFISLGSLLQELLSYSRFEYWEKKRGEIETKWADFRISSGGGA